jgi:hypothetical protein
MGSIDGYYLVEEAPERSGADTIGWDRGRIVFRGRLAGGRALA